MGRVPRFQFFSFIKRRTRTKLKIEALAPFTLWSQQIRLAGKGNRDFFPSRFA